MSDRFAAFAGSLEAPASHAFPIVPSDASDLAEVTRAIYVGGGGNVALVMLSGAAVTLAGVVPGTILPMRVVRVSETGTTATQMIGLV